MFLQNLQDTSKKNTLNNLEDKKWKDWDILLYVLDPILHKNIIYLQFSLLLLCNSVIDLTRFNYKIECRKFKQEAQKELNMYLSV